MRPSCKRMPTKLCMMVEAGADHPSVPARFSDMGCGQPKNHHAASKQFILDDDLFAVFGVWKTFIIFTKYNHEIYFRSNCQAGCTLKDSVPDGSLQRSNFV